MKGKSVSISTFLVLFNMLNLYLQYCEHWGCI